MDRLQALLNGRTPKVKDPVSVDKVNHATERARLNNEDRKYNKIVYDNELKQANLYNQSVMPNTGKDIGVGFKINVYVIKLTQLLGVKGDLEKALTNFFASGVSIQRLRGTTKEAQTATDFFKKADILSTYNELMLYIKTYAQDIISDDSFKSQIFNSAFNPLVQLLLDTSALYPAFFEQLPPPTNVGQPTEDKGERKIYDTAREQSIGCYSLFNTMADYINNMIFRPIVKEDVSKYIKDNNVRTIFSRNPLAPAPVIIPVPIPAPVGPQPGGQPGGPPQPPQAQVPVLDPTDDNAITRLVEAKQAGENRFLFLKSSQDVADIVQQAQQDFQPLTPQQYATLARNLKAKIADIRRANGLGVQTQGSPANIQIATLAYQQAQQGQPAPPAPLPAPLPAPQPGGQPAPAPPAPQPGGATLRSIAEGEYGQAKDLTDTGNVWNAMGADALVQQLQLTQQEGYDLRAVVRDTLVVIKRLEDAKGRILRAKTPADVDEVLQNEAQATTTILERLIPVEQDRKDFIQAVINGMRDVRIQYRDIKAQDDTRPDYQQNNDERTLYGLGRERNNDLVRNAVLDFESMARRQARERDKDTIMELMPQLKGQEPKIRFMINKMRSERESEPNMWGKGKYENKQGIKQRASKMSILDEFDPKAEAFKKGIVMSGGCDTWGSMRGGMDNREWRYSGYGEVANEEDTPFKRMLGGMPNPFAPPRMPPDTPRPFLPYNASFEDEADEDYYNEILPEEGTHYAEQEKPVDMDEIADSIRKNNENYKVATGKMKSVKYKN